MNIWHDSPEGSVKKDIFDAFIEIPKGCKVKYELDKATGLLRVDRILYTSTVYPCNYGLIPLTLADDNDPLDVLVLCTEQIVPGAVVRCIPIGVIKMVDGKAMDEKVVAVPVGDPYYKHYGDITELPKHIFDEMMHFFGVYKELENKSTFVDNIYGKAEAEGIIEKCIKAYELKYKK
ncbi:MAG: inorganic diphosphatase [Candidatus Coproplasma sp.]